MTPHPNFKSTRLYLTLNVQKWHKVKTRHSYNVTPTLTSTRRYFKWHWATSSDVANFPTTWTIARSLCYDLSRFDNFCWKAFDLYLNGQSQWTDSKVRNMVRAERLSVDLRTDAPHMPQCYQFFSKRLQLCNVNTTVHEGLSSVVHHLLSMSVSQGK